MAKQKSPYKGSQSYSIVQDDLEIIEFKIDDSIVMTFENTPEVILDIPEDILDESEKIENYSSDKDVLILEFSKILKRSRLSGKEKKFIIVTEIWINRDFLKNLVKDMNLENFKECDSEDFLIMNSGLRSMMIDKSFSKATKVILNEF